MVSKTYYDSLEERSLALLNQRGIYGHVAADRFSQDFISYLIRYDATGIGSAEKTLTLLENDEFLTPSTIFKTNFRKNLLELISPNLNADPIFNKMVSVLISAKGKGVGVGELFFPLIIAGYKFSNVSDGIYDTDKKIELKMDGASLKTLPSDITKKGHVDELNSKYFNGTVPGLKSEKEFEKHLQTIKTPDVYADYFKELYPGQDVTTLIESVKQSYKNPITFSKALGKFALKQYQKIDKWNNILFIDCDTLNLVNIADVNDIDHLGLKFYPKLSRKKDTQAIPDGYVNVKI